MLGLRDVQSFCGMHEGESLGVRNLERGNTKLSLKDVPSICSGGADLRGDSVLSFKDKEGDLNATKGAIVDVCIFII
jgi:hypothetical protein